MSARSAARTSARRPARRSRSRRNGGSTRVETTRRSGSGACSANRSRSATISGEAASWRSSKHEHHGIRARIERVQQRGDEVVEPGHLRARKVREVRPGDAERAERSGPEPLTVALGRLQAQPRHLAGGGARVDPFAQQGGLAPPGGGADERERRAERLEHVAQAGSTNQRPGRARRHQLRRQELHLGARSSRRRVLPYTPLGSYPPESPGEGDASRSAASKTCRMARADAPATARSRRSSRRCSRLVGDADSVELKLTVAGRGPPVRRPPPWASTP